MRAPPETRVVWVVVLGFSDLLREAQLTHSSRKDTGDLAPSSGRMIEVPEEIWTDSIEFSRSVETALQDAGIKILYMERIDELNRPRESLIGFLSRGGPGLPRPGGRTP